MYFKIKQRNPRLNSRGNHPIASYVESALQGERTWRNAYSVEQIIISLFSQEELEIELNKRMIEAKRNLDKDAYAAYVAILEGINQEADRTDDEDDYAIEPYHERNDTYETIDALIESGDDDKTMVREMHIPVAKQSRKDEKKRTLLGRLVNDLQWRYELRQLRREYGSQTRIRTGLFSILSIIAFYLPYYLIHYFTNDIKVYYVLTAITAGWMGASFSMVLSLKHIIQDGTLEDLQVVRRYPYILSRIIIGVGAGLLFFYFLQADILQGQIFPSFTEAVQTADYKGLKSMTMALNNKNLALLIIWCFLAGFSEKLVPSILSKTEAQVQTDTDT